MKNKLFTLALCMTALVFTNCSSDDDNTPSQPINIVIEGAAVAPTVGGPNQQNQVYVDLSTNTTTSVQRDSWDLGFYSGTEFRIVINGSIEMTVAELTTNDIDNVNASTQEVLDLQPQMEIGNPGTDLFVDNPEGDIPGTAISEVSSTDDNNKVYLVNLGYEVGTETPPVGSISVSGDSRGWKKIRILKNGNDYILQYADLDATTHNEVTISKQADYNFTFFSFNTETEINIEPEKTKWDLNFSRATQILSFGPGISGAYGYSDYVLNNTKSNATVYSIDTEVDTDLSYDNFTLADVIDTNFTNDQRGIGSSWRNGGGPGALPSLKDNVFYVVNDTDGNLYKLKFIALTNAAGERGYPEFVYSLLQ